MLNKLNQIFQDNGFEVVNNNDNLKILKRNDNEKFEYFLLIQSTNIANILEEKQLQYLKILKDTIRDKEVDKNSTLLICFESEILPLNLEIYKEILKIEEDPYFFRKLVLPYTQEQVGFLENPDEFGNIIKDMDKFEEFKDACKNRDLTNSQYEIISQLYIKLPFFKLPIISNIKNIVLDQYKSSLSAEETKALEFLERTNTDDILDNDDFFKKLEDLK